MKIAVEGCAHGELNKIYECIRSIELREQIKVDLLICCGDFQSVRDKCDMNSMAVPQKYMEMKDFREYYTGEKVAPILTLFIGGNHEASNYLWELPYGGWVAENIYYLGYAGVVDFAGLRIGGASGIYKKHDYLKDHFEMPPFNNDTKRSFYHVRKRDIDKLKLMQSDPPDILLSHDWPMNIYNHGNKEQLIRFKPFLKDEIETGTLGNKGAEELLNHVKPAYWFSGHMHARFDALVDHPDGKKTKFLALDKCLPKRKFLQVIDMGEAKGDAVLKYDAFWVGILKLTNDLTRFQELNEEHVPNKEMVNELSCGNLDVFPFSKSLNGENLQTTKFCERFDLKNLCKAQSWKSIKSTTKKSAELDNQSQQQKSNFTQFPSRTPKLKMNLPKPGTGDTTVHKKLPVSQKNNCSAKIDNDDDEFGDISNPNSSNLVDSDHSDSDSSSGSSSSSSGSRSTGSSDDEDEKVSIKNKVKKKTSEMPSFIETPACAATPKYQTGTPFGSTSTPFKWKEREEKMPIKALSFLDSSVNSDRSSDEAKVKDGDLSSIELTKGTSQNTDIPVCNDLSMDILPKNIPSIVKQNDKPSIVKQNEDKDTQQTPVKKFKLIRRNQSIYTPTKEEE